MRGNNIKFEESRVFWWKSTLAESSHKGKEGETIKEEGKGRQDL